MSCNKSSTIASESKESDLYYLLYINSKDMKYKPKQNIYLQVKLQTLEGEMKDFKARTVIA